jgi:phage baseplate assembly protein V
MSKSFVFSEVARRLNNIVRFGTVAEIDLKKARVRIKIGKITTNWMPWLTTAGAVKLWNPPIVGEQVCVVSQGGDLSLAVAIPSIFQNKFAAPGDNSDVVKLELSSQASIEFNKASGEFTVQIDDAEMSFSNSKFQVSIGASAIEVTPTSISINAPTVSIPGLVL